MTPNQFGLRALFAATPLVAVASVAVHYSANRQRRARGPRPSRFTPAADNCGMFDSLELLEFLAALLPERKFVPAEPRVIENEIQRVSDATAALGERLTAVPTPVGKQPAD